MQNWASGTPEIYQDLATQWSLHADQNTIMLQSVISNKLVWNHPSTLPSTGSLTTAGNQSFNEFHNYSVN